MKKKSLLFIFIILQILAWAEFPRQVFDEKKYLLSEPPDSLQGLDSLIQAFTQAKNQIDQEEERAQNRPRTKIEWKETSFDFGTVITGEKISHQYFFENKGENDFYITRVKTSCGCTSPKWSTKPVPPGGTGFVELLFDSTDRDGDIKKTANVLGNFEGDTHQQLILTGKVLLVD